ncbi:MAG: hypothetical protein HY741_14105 [Chloroflexi bacterium]|nr:hypothetical protein [Chloroflexota bacterium]
MTIAARCNSWASNDWSHWQGEPNTYALHQITEADLQTGGQYEQLGREAGFGRPLMLDEALTDTDEK